MLYYLVFGFLYLVSLLPLRVLFVLSDLTYLILYYLVGYRRDVVKKNLLQAFPDKTEEERIAIEKKFYRNFTDTFIETIKLISASDKFINRHFIIDTTVFDNLYDRGLRCQALASHNFNWEYAGQSLPMNLRYTIIGIYMPIKNKIFEKLLYRMRTKRGLVMLKTTNMREEMMPYRDAQYLITLVADQNPANLKRANWVMFFNKLTPFVRGPEKGARYENTAIVFGYITKPRRGYYKAEYVLADEDLSVLPEGELTKRYARYLENVISRSPETYLWSHKRWKHEWKEGVGTLLE